MKEIVVPDVGGGKVDVIEILVAVGDTIAANAPLLTVESEKASMDIPSTIAGVIKEILVKVGDKLTEGQLIVKIAPSDVSDSDTPKKAEPIKAESKATAEQPNTVAKPVTTATTQSSSFKDSLYAGPAVRRIGREFGIDLTQITGTGEKNRITKEDVQNYVRQRLSQSGGSNLGFNIAAIPNVDFTKFGPIEIKPLSKINKFTGANLHRNWLSIPHVTQFDEADITELEAYRVDKKVEFEAKGFKLTLIVFIMKIVVEALKKYPRFNASLDASGENLILKNYYHIGVAVDTPNGLVVPVIRDVDKKGVLELAKELGELSKKAREKGLTRFRV
jgi:pyruvate dehydrogenase E2 component (dihydrolipoamide acetyltransferase)